MKSSFLSIIFCLSLLCSNNQLNSGTLTNKLINVGLITGGACLSLITFLKISCRGGLAAWHLEVQLSDLEQDNNNANSKKELSKKIEKLCSPTKKEIAIAITGLLMSGLGLYRSVSKKI